jgi:hypothetical protein
MRKTRKNVIEIKRVIVSERLIYNGMEGRDKFILDMIFFLSTNTVVHLEIVVENAIQGNSAEIR